MGAFFLLYKKEYIVELYNTIQWSCKKFKKQILNEGRTYFISLK